MSEVFEYTNHELGALWYGVRLDDGHEQGGFRSAEQADFFREAMDEHLAQAIDPTHQSAFQYALTLWDEWLRAQTPEALLEPPRTGKGGCGCGG